ncbi:MAG: radical SAM protein [bacterium]
MKDLKEKTKATDLFIIGDVTKFNSSLIEKNGLGDNIIRDFFVIDKEKWGEFSLPKHYLFNLKKYGMPYSLKKQVATVLTTYGCPFNCAFCNSGSYGYKERPVEEIILELSQLKKMGIKEICFRDFTFTANLSRVKEICEEMINSDLNFVWSCEARVSVTEDVLKLMKKAGCYLIFFGVETLNDRTLEAMRKGINSVMIKKAFSVCRDLKIETLASFIIGLPGEDEVDYANTLEFAKKHCNYASFNTYEPRPGASLQDKGSHLFTITKQIEKSFYIRPSYILKQILCVRSVNRLINFFRNGKKILFND